MSKLEYAKKIFFTHLKQNKDIPDNSILDSLNCSSLITGISVRELAASLKLNINTIIRKK